jgi:hypothetical protein
MLNRLSTFAKYALPVMAVWMFSMHFAHAISLFGFDSLTDFVSFIFATISSLALEIMSLWVALTGMLLNVSITMTLQIKDFVNSTPGVYLVWETIRDISGMFVIFMLLYASFKIILGFDTVGGVGGLIKNIVIMGILINFSFFITSMLIDASNVVSLALYQGIVGTAPATVSSGSASGCQQANGGSSDINTCGLATQAMSNVTGGNGGLSAIFLNLLKPQGVYNTSNTNTAAAAKQKPLMIIIQGIVGCIIMFTIGVSFLLASLAFMARLIILVLLLAFSPIWFASMIVPGIADKTKEFKDHLTSQLIFMPVYLLLLYAAMRFLSSSTIFTFPSSTAFTGSGAGTTFNYASYVVLAINDFFIIFLLNMPLVVAFSMGGAASKWLNTDKFGAKNIWKSVGSTSGRNTVGRVAYGIHESEAMKTFAGNHPTLGRITSKGLSNISNAGFGEKKGGYKDKLEARKKDQEALYKQLGTVDESKFDTTTEKGKAALKAAQESAGKAKDAYIENLAPSSILASMLFRSDRQTAKKLGDQRYGDKDKIDEDKALLEKLKKQQENPSPNGPTVRLKSEKSIADQIKDVEARIIDRQKKADKRDTDKSLKEAIEKITKENAGDAAKGEDGKNKPAPEGPKK